MSHGSLEVKEEGCHLLFLALRSGSGCSSLLEVRQSLYRVGSNTDSDLYGSYKSSMLKLRAPFSRMLAACACNDLLL